MKKLYTTLLILSLSGVLFAASPAGDRGKGPQGGPPQGNGMMNWVKDLDLSKDQLGKVEDLRQDQDKEAIAVGKALKDLHKALRKELAKGNIDDGRVNDLVNQLTEQQRLMLVQHVKYAKAYKNILTSDQQKKLNEKVEEMETKMMERHAGEGMMGGMMGGPRPR